jgi:uncharacterized RDD family membrane protein YckC
MPGQQTQDARPDQATARQAQVTERNGAPARSSPDDALPGPRVGDGVAEAAWTGDGSQSRQAAAVTGQVARPQTTTWPGTTGQGPEADLGPPAAGQTTEPGCLAAAGPQPASWQRRLVGYLIDSLIIFVVTSALWIRLFISFGDRMSNTLNAHPRTGTAAAQAAIGRVFSNTLGPFLIELVFTMVLAVLYYWLLTGNWGTTVGKRCVSAWVVPADCGNRPGQGASFVRAVVFVVCAPIPALFLIDSLWLFAGPRRQCLHDRAARTIVVRGRPPQRSSVPAAVSPPSSTAAAR